MNPSELRMMWMSQYNPERISLEDAASFFHPTVGLSVMDDMTQQQAMVSRQHTRLRSKAEDTV